MDDVRIINAYEKNLKNVSIDIPRGKLVVFTGISGSGKSTLAVDVLFNECQRQYLEALGMQGIKKPKVESILHASPAILIAPQDSNRNPRSTLGTVSDIYTDLRMIYEKMGLYDCPLCSQTIYPYKCKEELEKHDGEFTVYLYCNHCGKRIPKITRSFFSANTREGACPTCKGLGKTLTIDDSMLFNEELSLEEGAVDFWEQAYRDYQIKILYKAYEYAGLDSVKDKPLKEYSALHRLILIEGMEKAITSISNQVCPKSVNQGRFEGVYPLLWRRISEKGSVSEQLSKYFVERQCNECHGEKLNKQSRNVKVMGKRIPELVGLSLEELGAWLNELKATLPQASYQEVHIYLLDLKTKIDRLVHVGLGYLSLDRQTMTLSGGEAQRLRLAATLDSNLTGIIYIMDEPTLGLHSKDTSGILKILKDLKNKGNTLLIIEHDEDIMREADFIVDLGKGSGKLGGEIIAAGSIEDIMNNPESLTGNYLMKGYPIINHQRISNQYITIKNATQFNLKHVNVKIPMNCFVSICGVSGSGKSTLIFDVLAQGGKSKENVVEGLEEFDQVIKVEQSTLTRMKRSNVATYSGVYSEIRKVFGEHEETIKKGFTQKDFSFNSKGGRCEHCEGLGHVSSSMLFFQDIEVDCPVCGGKQFHDEILAIKVHNLSIKEVLNQSIDEAFETFKSNKRVVKYLSLLKEVGLGYLELGQSLTTLSLGEGQRLKLAKDLMATKKERVLYLIDEPTMGLHPYDIKNFLILLQKMVDAGNSVIVVEHNLQVNEASDWIIELGEGGGIHGGNLVCEGTPTQLMNNPQSLTGLYLKLHNKRLNKTTPIS